MTMYGGLHPKSDVDRQYVKRKEGGRGLISVGQRIREKENSLGFYVEGSMLLTRKKSLLEGYRQLRQLIRERL